MKSYVKIILVALALILCLSSCLDGNSTPAEKAIEEVSAIIDAGFDSYTFTLTIVSNETKHTLTETYTVTGSGEDRLINYEIKAPNKFDIVDGEIIVPDSYESIYLGQLTEGCIIPDFDFTAIKDPGYANGIVTANITSISDFMSLLGLNIKSARFAISYANDKIGYIAIYLTASNNDSITLKYIPSYN